MDYSKAVCKTLPNEMKELFFSSRLNELLKAAEVCSNCEVREDCYQLGTSLWKNNGVWGGKILSRGQPVAESTIRSRRKIDGTIKFQWY